jgi:hypothetical protein
VYVLESSPAQQTAAPLAARMGVAVNVIASGSWKPAWDDIRGNHAGEIVMLVASREQLQTLLGQISDQEWTIEEPDYGSVFVVSESRLNKPSIIRLRY